MRAVCLYEHGGIDALKLVEDFADPQPGKGQVVIRVRATSLNYHDVFTCQGMPGIKVPMPMIIGLDIAGEIVDVGPETAGWSRGDRVLVNPLDPIAPEKGLMGELVHGGTAEYCRVDATRLIRIPEGVSFDQAAALPVAYGTAHRMLFTHGRLTKDDRVLILGASGGVGSCCVLLAKMVGAEVIACGSTPDKLEALKSWGADKVINYAEKPEFEKVVWEMYDKPHRRKYTGGVTMVVNFTGGDTWVRSLKSLRRGGRLLTCGATAGFDPKEDLRYIWSFELQVIGSNSWAPEDLVTLMDMIKAKRLDPIVDSRLALADTREGVRKLRDREVIGKVIINP
jgi:alcohol dehydrogenase